MSEPTPEPIFTPEPASALPPKKKMSTGLKVALGCGLLALCGVGTCGGGMLWCGNKIASSGNSEWTDLRAVANDLMTDGGARAEYASHPGLAEAYPTADDFVGAARLWRPDLEPLPEAMPSLFSGKIGIDTNSVNGSNTTHIAAHLGSGKALVGTWKNGKLTDLQLE